MYINLTNCTYITDSVDLSQQGNYTWTIDIDSASLAQTTQYMLKFLPPQVGNDIDHEQIPSTGFFVLPATTSISTTTLSTGAKAGIGVGVSLSVIFIVLAILMFIYRRRAMTSSTPDPIVTPPEYGAVAGPNKHFHASELPHELFAPPAQLDAEDHPWYMRGISLVVFKYQIVRAWKCAVIGFERSSSLLFV